MKIETLFCDRCGKECEISRCNHGFNIYTKKFILANVHNYDAPMDLCQDCYDSLAEWMEVGKTDKAESDGEE